MAITPGTRIGSYEVIALIGAGGMGEVYRARDTNLDRDVALKILPEAFAADPDRLSRFEREAKTLASLSHPNVAAIYDRGLTPELRGLTPVAFLVMELVEGDDLTVHIARGAINLADALPIARQIADALEAAHESGIVHRDLKPANVKVRADGTVKVLDFGLAKALSPDSGPGTPDSQNSPTLTARATQMGMIIGTAAYMAPEQARGRSVDRRADIWAFGVVLYEMLSGQRAFDGDDISITLASVLKEDVKWDALPADVPPALRTLMKRCLEKDPKRRLGWISEARHVLDDPAVLTAAPIAPAGVPAPPAAFWRRVLPWGIAALGVASALAMLVAFAPWRNAAPPATVLGKFITPVPQGVSFTRTGRRFVAISADGSKVAFIANQQIYVRNLHETVALPLRGTHVDPAELAFSPDGNWLAFFVPPAIQGPLEKTVLKKVPVTGGTPMELCPANAPYGLRWQGKRILFSTGAAIQVVAESGGTPQTLVSVPVDSKETLAQPQLLNDGRDLLYTVRAPGTDFNDGKIVVQPVAGGDRKVIVPAGSDGRVLPTGHLVYLRDSTLLAQPFDTARLETTGGAVPVNEQVRFASNSGAGQFDIASNGTLVFAAGTQAAAFRMVWVDRTGKEEFIPAEPKAFYFPRVSPEGSRIALASIEGTDRDLWVWDIERKALSRITKEPSEEGYPVWSADGKFLYFRANPEGVQFDIYRRAADGSGQAERLTRTTGSESPLQLLPGNARLLIRAGEAASADNAVRILPLADTAKQEPIQTQLLIQSTAEVSPDGRWLLYQSAESNTQEEVWVRPFPATDSQRWQISINGGGRPMWSRSGREIFFRRREGTQFHIVSVAVPPIPAGAPFKFGTPVPLFDVANYSFLSVARTYDISHDDKRFVFLSTQSGDPTAKDELVVMVNWVDAMRAAVRK